MSGKQQELELMRKAVDFLDGKLIDEVVDQGHHLTGAFEASLRGSVLDMGIRTQAIGNMALYGIFLNLGVHPDRIPFGGPSTGAKTSKYIEGLTAFWMLRGLSEKEAKSAAFATAKKHKKDGMPSSGSYRFSNTGQRTQFIEIVDAKATPELNGLMTTGIDAIVDKIFHETKSETI